MRLSVPGGTEGVKDAAAQPARLAKLCLALGDGDVADEALPVRVERWALRVGRQLGPHLVAAARLAGERGTERLARVGPLELPLHAAAALGRTRLVTRPAGRGDDVATARQRSPSLLVRVRG